jgi:hypothetical protein
MGNSVGLIVSSGVKAQGKLRGSSTIEGRAKAGRAKAVTKENRRPDEAEIAAAGVDQLSGLVPAERVTTIDLNPPRPSVLRSRRYCGVAVV